MRQHESFEKIKIRNKYNYKTLCSQILWCLMDNVKKINIKNCAYYFVNDIIKGFSHDNAKIDENSYKMFLNITSSM